jgi:hypothetical protein
MMLQRLQLERSSLTILPSSQEKLGKAYVELPATPEHHS